LEPPPPLLLLNLLKRLPVLRLVAIDDVAFHSGAVGMGPCHSAPARVKSNRSPDAQG
jgi:hypothetical protein